MRLAQSPLCTRQRPNSGHCGRSELCQKQTSGLLIGVYFDTLMLPGSGLYISCRHPSTLSIWQSGRRATAYPEDRFG